MFVIFSPHSVIQFLDVGIGHFHGSIFVSIYARKFLEGSSDLPIKSNIEVNVSSGALQDSNYIDDLDHIIRCFDKTTKPRFRDANEPQYVKFGSTRDNDAVHNIRFGQLKLFG